MTPREIYESMKNGGDVQGKMDSAQAAVAKAILRRQAGTLTKERCLMRIYFAEDDQNPWSCSLVFANGELSEEAQSTLTKMRSNAHNTTLMDGKRQATITFYVITMEDENE